MAPHSSILAWKIPWMEEPGRLPSMGSLKVRHDSATSFSLFTFLHWRRKWQPTPVFLPGESQGRVNVVGCRLWGRTELDRTEVTQKQSTSSKGKEKKRKNLKGNVKKIRAFRETLLRIIIFKNVCLKHSLNFGNLNFWGCATLSDGSLFTSQVISK